MKVLFLILASDTHPIYLKHQACWRRYMKSHPDVDAYFYKGNPNQEEEYKLEGDTLWIRIPESIPNVYPKTLMAFKYFLPRLSDYDFVFRANMSTFIVFDRYLEFCSHLSKQNTCSAVIGTFDGIAYPSGCGYTLSPDLVKRIVENPIPQHYIDDVTIGKMMGKWGIPIFRAPRIIIGDLQAFRNLDLTKEPNNFHFRCRNDTRENIDDEIFVINKLIDYFYSDTI
jgi:hypothetical protein